MTDWRRAVLAVPRILRFAKRVSTGYRPKQVARAVSELCRNPICFGDWAFGHAWFWLLQPDWIGLELAPMRCPCTLRRARRGQTTESYFLRYSASCMSFPNYSSSLREAVFVIPPLRPHHAARGLSGLGCPLCVSVVPRFKVVYDKAQVFLGWAAM